MAVPRSKDEAQRRADQIRAFQAELADLRRDGVQLPDRLDAIAAHHDALLATLASRFDIDRSSAAKRMSLGMRLASAFGAAALTAAVVSFFYRIWGSMPTGAQVAALTAAPLVALAAMVIAARRERTLYVASLFAIVACGAFVLQTIMVGALFNTRGSPHALAAWCAFALAVALPYGLVLPFAAAVVAGVCYGAALITMALGASWRSFIEHPETVMAAAAVAYVMWPWPPRHLEAWHRGSALVMGLAPLLALSTFEARSLLPLGDRMAEVFYQLGSAVLAALVVTIGIKRARAETVVIGAIFGGLFLLGRFFDWWWDWMPKYLFFLLLATVALAWLWLLRRFRRRLAEAPV